MTSAQRTAAKWFEEAARCYLEHHQGCAWCGGSHKVFQRQQGSQVAYECFHCDFRVSCDEATRRYFFTPGAEPKDAPQDTMYGF